MIGTPTWRDVVRATAITKASISAAGCSSSSGASNEGPTGGGGGDVSKTVDTTVTWENAGNVGHTVTAYGDEIPDEASYFASSEFDSESAAVDGYHSGQEGNLTASDTYEQTFETEGTYKYYCIPHESGDMVGSST